MDVEVCRRSTNWQSQHYLAGDSIWLESIDFTLPIKEVYLWVEIEPIEDDLQTIEEAENN